MHHIYPVSHTVLVSLRFVSIPQLRIASGGRIGVIYSQVDCGCYLFPIFFCLQKELGFSIPRVCRCYDLSPHCGRDQGQASQGNYK